MWTFCHVKNAAERMSGTVRRGGGGEMSGSGICLPHINPGADPLSPKALESHCLSRLTSSPASSTCKANFPDIFLTLAHSPDIIPEGRQEKFPENVRRNRLGTFVSVRKQFTVSYCGSSTTESSQLIHHHPLSGCNICPASCHISSKNYRTSHLPHSQ